MSERLEHPDELEVLGARVYTTDGDFKDLAECETMLGTVFFARANGGRWTWSLAVEEPAPDDIQSLDRDSSHVGLAGAVSDANRILGALVTRAREAVKK